MVSLGLPLACCGAGVRGVGREDTAGALPSASEVREAATLGGLSAPFTPPWMSPEVCGQNTFAEQGKGCCRKDTSRWMP